MEKDEKRKERINLIITSVFIIGVIVASIILKNVFIPLGYGLMIFGIFKAIQHWDFVYFFPFFIAGLVSILINTTIELVRQIS